MNDENGLSERTQRQIAEAVTIGVERILVALLRGNMEVTKVASERFEDAIERRVGAAVEVGVLSALQRHAQGEPLDVGLGARDISKHYDNEIKRHVGILLPKLGAYFTQRVRIVPDGGDFIASKSLLNDFLSEMGMDDELMIMIPVMSFYLQCHGVVASDGPVDGWERLEAVGWTPEMPKDPHEEMKRFGINFPD